MVLCMGETVPENYPGLYVNIEIIKEERDECTSPKTF